MVKLGINIDHVATIRQARRETEPDPVEAAIVCQKLGVDSIVAHLREDRRHIQDMDIVLLKKVIKKRFNLEMSTSPEVVKIALSINPNQVTLVPERRQEITTEGGLDVVRNLKRLGDVCEQFRRKGIQVSLFIAPNQNQIRATKKLGVSTIELHTGAYAHAFTKRNDLNEYNRLKSMTLFAHEMGIVVNVGHGLNYQNVSKIARIKYINELNIGHSIISRSVFVGLKTAVKEMLQLIKK